MKAKNVYPEPIIARLRNWRATHTSVTKIAEEVGKELGYNFTSVLAFMLKNDFYTVSKRYEKNLPNKDLKKDSVPKVNIIKEKSIFLNESATIKIGEVVITLPGNSVTINGQKISW